jgi:hypothetical protein
MTSNAGPRAGTGAQAATNTGKPSTEAAELWQNISTVTWMGFEQNRQLLLLSASKDVRVRPET